MEELCFPGKTSVSKSPNQLPDERCNQPEFAAAWAVDDFDFAGPVTRWEVILWLLTLALILFTLPVFVLAYPPPKY